MSGSRKESLVVGARKYWALALVVALVGSTAAVTVALAANSSKGNFRTEASMNGRKVISGGDTDGKGDAEIVFKKKKDRVCYEISYRRIQTANKGILGEGRSGREGDVVVTLFRGTEKSPVEDCIRAPSKKTIKKIEETPKDYFVALENNEHPRGAIRGQLRHRN